MISQGLVGPKAMAKAAANGHAVNIRQLPYFSDGETESSMLRVLLDSCLLDKNAVQANPDGGRKANLNRGKTRVRAGMKQSAFPRKSSKVKDKGTVP